MILLVIRLKSGGVRKSYFEVSVSKRFEAYGFQDKHFNKKIETVGCKAHPKTFDTFPR
jgi:hypothetical protein